MNKIHHTFKLEVYEKLFHFDDFELKSGLNEPHFFNMDHMKWTVYDIRPIRYEAASLRQLKSPSEVGACIR